MTINSVLSVHAYIKTLSKICMTSSIKIGSFDSETMLKKRVWGETEVNMTPVGIRIFLTPNNIKDTWAVVKYK